MLVERDPTRTPVAVPGWRVVALPDVVYPGLIPDHASTATGELLTDLTPEEWRIIDDFEDPRYDLTRVTTSDGLDAYAYTDPVGPLANAPAWDRHRFTDADLPAFLVRCFKWRQRHDTRT